MTMKELLEGYLVMVEAQIERLEDSVESAKREIASDAVHGHRLGGIESIAQNAREKEIELDVLKEVRLNLKDILKNGK